MKSILPAVCAAALLLPGGWAVAQSPPPPEMSDGLRIDVDGAKQAIQKHNAIVVDVRGDAAFRTGHIAGAISLPNGADLKAKAEEFKKSGRSVITYCA